MRAQSSSQRSQGESPIVEPRRRGGSGSSSTAPDARRDDAPRPASLVRLGRPRRRPWPTSDAIDARRSASWRRKCALAGVSPGPPSSSVGPGAGRRPARARSSRPTAGRSAGAARPCRRAGGAGPACRPAGHAVRGCREELGEAAVGLEVAPDHDRVVRLERLRHPVDERPREAQRVADLAHGRARPVRHEVADHAGVLGAVALVDVLDDLLAARRGEVDVHVRVGRAALVDEALEEQLVADGVDAGDAQRVGHDRIARAAPTLRGDAALAAEAHEVPADEEELGEAGALDDLELVGHLLEHARVEGVVAPARALVAELREVGERRLARRHREAREAVALELELDLAARGQLDRVRDALEPGGPRPGSASSRPGGSAASSSAPLSAYSALGRRRWALSSSDAAVADGHEHVLELPVGAQRVVRRRS